MPNKVNTSDSENDIVITGMSGQFPNSKNVKEFEYNLYNKIQMIDDRETRWKHIYPGVPKMIGKIPILNKFDATFFGIHQHQAARMDCQMRILLEEAYKAIMDAGVNPSSLRNTNTGVYIAVCTSESDAALMYCENADESGLGLLGTSKSLLANRISFFLGLNGPSMACDTACSSSMYALNIAYEHMKSGIIDAAIVGGTNLLLCPYPTKKFAKLGVLSPTGNCRPFDEASNGYVRSEAVCCIFLQRQQDAKRIYATFIHSATNCDGFKSEGITYPSGLMQTKLISKFYDGINIDLDELGYMEAHSTGTVVGDPEECRAIDQYICKRRKNPLLIGSVKSNCGHTEASSGLVSLVKVLLTFNNNSIPPNINFSKVRNAIDGIREGRLIVVTETTELKKPYICVNSFGFGGANAHSLFKQYPNKISDSSDESKIDLPYIMTWSSRRDNHIDTFFDTIESKPFNPEHLALIRSSQAGGIQGMVYRGYNILKTPNNMTSSKNPSTLSRLVQYYDGVKHPNVWVFSGMGSQWVGMGKDLMKIRVCSESILKSHAILKSEGLDLINIITSDDPNTFDNILNSFVGITAIQIALVDLLHHLQLKPDYIIGHSVGEVCCAYADGCLTAKQTILAAFYRGKVSIDTDKIHGSMAAVGMGFKDIAPILPPSIDVACHNSSDSCTISGPSSDISDFVEILKSKKIFIKEVVTSNIAYHSRYIQHLGPNLLKYLRKLIPNPKLRSNKWISTSVPSDKWLLNDSKFCSAEYSTNNLMNSVLFEESSEYLPKNSLTIEIAPHALLQSILKSCNPNGIHIGLTKRKCENYVLYLLEALGKLYLNGVELCLANLYPSIQWPVSRGVPTISDIIGFDHTQDHIVYYYENECIKSGNKTIRILSNTEHKYLFGHNIDGRSLVPATFYIECVWKTFAIMQGSLNFDTVDVEFENVEFFRATTLSNKDQIELHVSIQRGTGTFEITESETLVVRGIIKKISGQSEPSTHISNGHTETLQLSKKDFYKELKLRGYHYKDGFQSVELAYANGYYGKIKWFNNWVTFMDCMLQMSIVIKDSRNMALPIKLRSLRIFSNYQTHAFPDKCEIEVYSDGTRVVAGGIEITGLKVSHVQRRKPPGKPMLEKYQFMPNIQGPRQSNNDISRCCVQLFLENFPKSKCLIVQVASSTETEFIFLMRLIQTVNDLPTIQSSNVVLTNINENSDQYQNLKEYANITFINSVDQLENNVDILLIDEKNVSEILSTLRLKLAKNAMILIKTINGNNPDRISLPQGYKFIALFPSSESQYSIVTLLTNVPDEGVTNQEDEIFVKVSQYDNEFLWLDELKHMIGRKVVLVAENEPYNGLLGLINCLRREPETRDIRCVFIDDLHAPEFDPSLPFYKNQLGLGLAINIYRKGQWGTYRHLELTPNYRSIEHRDHIRGAIENIGEFTTLHWQSGPLEKNEAKIRIVYSALNFRDVMHASGRLSAEDAGLSRLEQSSIFGLEYSGIDEKTGRPTMGMVKHSSVASYLEGDPIVSWEVPNKWTLQEAATIPVVYTTVYYAFFFTVDIRTGKDILIHSGSGGVGIAAIRTAIAYGLEVYTTVSTTEKKNFLLQAIPQLKEANIGNSRDCSFEEMIRLRTNGRGVDFILNSLSDDKLKASLRCLAPNGHFIEIGKFDMANDSSIGLGVFFQGQHFHAVLTDKLMDYVPHLLNKIKSHIDVDIENGIIQPLPSTVFKPHELENAFRFLMTAKHIGKVLIEIRPNVESPATYSVSVIPKMFFNKQFVYVVPGGLGGFGLELVDWMILRGARKIVLNSRHGLTDDYQKLRISIWKSYNCKIAINTSDITTEKGCLELLTESMKLGSIGGILNLAVQLMDGIFLHQTSESFQQSFGPKAFATMFLDKLSQKLCPRLHIFLIFSSVSCGRGNAGQTNYGMANSIMERIIEKRVSLGLPGKAIQFGAIGEVGLLTVMTDGKIDVNISGTLQQHISSCLQVLDILLTSPDPVVTSMVVAEKKILTESQTAFQFVTNTLSLTELKSISVNSTLSELGMDSLLGIEIKQALERNFNIILTPAELRALTIERLRELSDIHKKKSDNIQDSNQDKNILNIMDSFYFNITMNIDNAEYVLSLNNIKSNDVPIIIVPGIEGCCTEVWKIIGDQLKAPALLIQFLVKFEADDFKSFLESIVKNILNVLDARRLKTFRIVAYSFGTLIALTVVKYLESLGYHGSIVLIDGSPLWLEYIGSKMINISTIDLERRITLITLKNSLNNIYTTDLEELISNSCNRDSIFWNMKEVLAQHKIENINEYIKVVRSMLFITECIIDPNTYKAVEIIESKIMLIKPSTLLLPNIDKLYGLQPITRNAVEEQTVNGDHQTILRNEIIPKLINQFFDI